MMGLHTAATGVNVGCVGRTQRPETMRTGQVGAAAQRTAMHNAARWESQWCCLMRAALYWP